MALKDRFSLRTVWGIFMVIIFFGMAFMVFFTGYFPNLTGSFRTIFGIIFLIYGFFRAWQVWKLGK
ncbi:MAG: hypothetical protein Q8914_03810 [Bacteroidota bacterium]|nr:hypothetical protein [Bacteroidota bacterium]